MIEAGLELLGGRAVINSVNYEDGDGPDSRFTRIMRVVREHGAAVIALTIDEAGQARTREHKVAVASRLIDALTGEWGMQVQDILVDTLTFTLGTGQEESRRDGLETIEGIRELKRRYPEVQTTLGLSNISFGLKPAARQVLNSVFLHECVKAGLDSAIVHAAKIVPVARIPQEQHDVALDLIYDRRRFAGEPGESEVTYDPLSRFLELFEGVDAASLKASRADALAALPLEKRLAQRIIDGERNGLEADLQAALDKGHSALDIINDHLLDGMRTVGELFGRGEMQLPFVLQSAEVMKVAVAYLEPHIEGNADGSAREAKAKIVLATVKGDVHDIGKNLVDIILSNNGYDVVNIGIKQPISEIIRAADEHDADAIGMSGLLVKSTVVMKENLEELNSRGVAARWPVLLGGAALTRAYVENDLAEVYEGEVRYARDAFEGLRLMDAVARARSNPEMSVAEALPELRKRRVRAKAAPVDDAALSDTTRSDVATDNSIPTPPFWGTRVVKGIALADYAVLPGRAGDVPRPVGPEGRPRRRPVVRRAGGDRGPAAAADVAGPDQDRQPARGGGRLRLLPLLQRGQRRRRAARRGPAEGAGAGAVHLPAPAARPAAVPRRLLPQQGALRAGRPARRHRVPPGHHGGQGRRGDGRAVRGQRLPRLPRAARPVGAADRGAGRAVARPGPRGARVRQPTTTSRWTRSCARATAARATPSATRPAPTSRTGPCWWSCSTPHASA